MLLENIPQALAQELNIRPEQAKAAIKLLDEGNTVPFIARYRKEATGELEDEQLRKLEERLAYLRNFVKRQEEILNKIAEQGKLTEELQQAIEKTTKLQELEDIYLPFKQKKRTRAQKAREKGLEPLSTTILWQKDTKGSIEKEASKYINPELEVNTWQEAMEGARDIIAEIISENAKLRQKLREYIHQHGQISTLMAEDTSETEEGQRFLMYKEYQEPVKTMPSHRILAINRGEKLGCLKVTLQLEEDKILHLIQKEYLQGPSIYQQDMKLAIEDSWKRLLSPSLERELRSQLTEMAETQAISIFGTNLKQLLLQAPLAGYTVMGLDPGYRTGCKMAVVSPTGQVLHHGVLYLTHGENRAAQSARTMLEVIRRYQVGLISIGNGTASLETEEFTAKLIKDNKLDVHYIITNEAGASVYSASALAKEELPEYDVTIRGAVSIARRVQDPLAELVKIDPKSIGVGQYQHDVDQTELKKSLDMVVESCVNTVGVNLNTASRHLLTYVSGLNATTAKNIVLYREQNGPFRSRAELKKVPRLGPATFVQCAGFLRIPDAKNPLDNSAVHPESYDIVKRMAEDKGCTVQQLIADKDLQKTIKLDRYVTPAVGMPTLTDIMAELQRPGRDPRAAVEVFEFDPRVHEIGDLQVGMLLPGIVTNITNFGAFVDVGVHQDGLVHISQLADRYVKDPNDVVKLHQHVVVRVTEVDCKRQRISLSMKE